MSSTASKAAQFINSAVELDQAGQYEEAIHYYEVGVQYLDVAVRHYRAVPQTQQVLRGKIQEYQERATALRQMMGGGGPRPRNNHTNHTNNNNRSTAPPAAAGGKSVAGNTAPLSNQRAGGCGGGGGDLDEEQQRRAHSLESAIVLERPNVLWSDVVGLADVKEALRTSVILPQKYPHLFRGKRKPWKGVLLYGPPGTGKSFIAKAVATEAACTFFSLSASNLTSKWMGESEKMVEQLFITARENRPCVLFIDEIDSVAGARGGERNNESSTRMLTQLLVEMDGVGTDNEGVLVLGATNCPWDLDPAIRRRLELRVLVPLPDTEGRRALFRAYTGDDHDVEDPGGFEVLAARTEGYSGSDIQTVCKQALMQPLLRLMAATHFRPRQREDGTTCWMPCADDDPEAVPCSLGDLDAPSVEVAPVGWADFEFALESTSPSVTKEEAARYHRYKLDMESAP